MDEQQHGCLIILMMAIVSAMMILAVLAILALFVILGTHLL